MLIRCSWHRCEVVLKWGTRPDLSLDTWGLRLTPLRDRLIYLYLYIFQIIYSHVFLFAFGWPNTLDRNRTNFNFTTKAKTSISKCSIRAHWLHVPGIHNGTLTLKLLNANFETLALTSHGGSTQYSMRFAHV